MMSSEYTIKFRADRRTFPTTWDMSFEDAVEKYFLTMHLIRLSTITNTNALLGNIYQLYILAQAYKYHPQ